MDDTDVQRIENLEERVRKLERLTWSLHTFGPSEIEDGKPDLKLRKLIARRKLA